MPASETDIRRGEIYAGYATDADIRGHASSGGVVSAILIYLLETGKIDGAIVSRIGQRGGGIRGVTEKAIDRAGVLRCAGSSYIETPVLEAARDLAGEGGRFALVGLPCQIRALRAQFRARPGLGESFPCLVGLFCRGTVSGSLYDDLFRKIGIDPSAVTGVRVRRGHIGGEVTVDIAGGGSRKIPFSRLNAYRIAGVHSMTRCLWCDEHLASGSDISVGDIFTGEFRKRAIKHSAFVCWTDGGASLMKEMAGRGLVTTEYFGMERYRRTFAGIEDFTNRLGPRYLAARLTGVPPSGERRPSRNIFQSLAWTVIFANNRLSRTPKGRKLLFGLPIPVIKLEAMAAKGLSRIRFGGGKGSGMV
jgi:coenzyme F420 hydrogenase subunit beta